MILRPGDMFKITKQVSENLKIELNNGKYFFPTKKVTYPIDYIFIPVNSVGLCVYKENDMFGCILSGYPGQVLWCPNLSNLQKI
jgi:hypothetical protein